MFRRMNPSPLCGPYIVPGFTQTLAWRISRSAYCCAVMPLSPMPTHTRKPPEDGGLASARGRAVSK